ncbi:PTPRR phosphatase, partial [Polyodon spathula]|nr:PTPRR phosphatase [Polyodon spathula]
MRKSDEQKITLQTDIRKLNNTLLQTFRRGVAAALDISPQQVHINRLNEKKNCIELTVSPPPDKLGTMERLSSEEVVRSLNVNILHKSLSQFGITEITPEKNVLQGQHDRDKVWTKEGFYAVAIFLTIFVIIITCLMVLYRLKEKTEFPDQRYKEQSREIHLAPIPLPTKNPEVQIFNSMVQPETVPRSESISANPQSQPAPEMKPCLSCSPSPFRIKSAGLQESLGIAGLSPAYVTADLDREFLGGGVQLAEHCLGREGLDQQGNPWLTAHQRPLWPIGASVVLQWSHQICVVLWHYRSGGLAVDGRVDGRVLQPPFPESAGGL